MRNASGIGTYLRGLLGALPAVAGSDWSLNPWTSNAPIYTIREQVEMPWAFSRSGADLFHAPHYNMPIAVASRTIVTVHDLIHLKFPQFLPSRLAKAYAEFFFHFVVPRARGILTVSSHTKQDLVELLHLHPDTITVTPLGAPDIRPQDVTPDAIHQVLSTFQLTPGYLFYAGNLKPFKNVPRLLRVYRQWAAAHPGVPPLVLAGRNFLPDLTNTLADTPGIRWLGEVASDQLPALYKSARAFVFPSLYEGFGLPPLEAMAYGTPVLCSNRASLPEVVGDAALLFDPEDDSALLSGLHRVMTDDTLRQQLSLRGLDRVRHFSWETTAQKTLEAYQRYA